MNHIIPKGCGSGFPWFLQYFSAGLPVGSLGFCSISAGLPVGSLGFCSISAGLPVGSGSQWVPLFFAAFLLGFCSISAGLPVGSGSQWVPLVFAAFLLWFLQHFYRAGGLGGFLQGELGSSCGGSHGLEPSK